MSPIGRVFIVLNLVLAGGFVYVSGTYLQKQHNYKDQLTKEQEAHTVTKTEKDRQIAELTTERNTFENAKISTETRIGELSNANAGLTDENKRLAQQLANIEGQVSQLVAAAQAANTESKAAFAQAKAAYDMAIADQKTKDEAVNAKDAALAENRDLKTKITSLEEAVSTRDKNIATLESAKSELQLLVKVAESYGFIRSMAAPNLAGTVTTASGRLCTIQITDNPGNINIKEAIELGKWGFAIYDASGYKGEAIAERYEEGSNAVLCRVFPVKGEIREGDKAATKTP
jgi:hypothetical protein